MWTTLTHLISCSVTLAFALLFKAENAFTYDFDKLRKNVEFARDFLRREEHMSSIASRGVRILTALLELEQSSQQSEDIEAAIGDTIRRVASDDGDKELRLPDMHQVVVPREMDMWQTFLDDSMAADFLDL